MREGKCGNVAGTVGNVDHIFKAHPALGFGYFGIYFHAVPLGHAFVDFKQGTGFAGVINTVADFADDAAVSVIRIGVLDEFAPPGAFYFIFDNRSANNFPHAGADYVVLHLDVIFRIPLFPCHHIAGGFENVRHAGIKLSISIRTDAAFDYSVRGICLLWHSG